MFFSWSHIHHLIHFFWSWFPNLSNFENINPAVGTAWVRPPGHSCSFSLLGPTPSLPLTMSVLRDWADNALPLSLVTWYDSEISTADLGLNSMVA
jgi:hypothetical protein